MFLMEDERTLTCAKACLDLAILYRDSKEAHEKLVANRGAAPAIELEKRTSYVYSERAKLLRTLISSEDIPVDLVTLSEHLKINRRLKG